MTLFFQAVVQGVLIGANYAIIALGMTVVYNITRILNFSHGDFITLALYMFLTMYTSWHLDPYISMFIAFPALFGLGVALFRYVLKPVLNKHILMVAQLTLGLMFIIQNGLLMTYGGEFQRVPSVVGATLISVGDLFNLRLPTVLAFFISAAVAWAFYHILKKTDFGRAIRAIHQNEKAAVLMGINVEKVQTLTFGLGIGILALSAGLLAPVTAIHPAMGLDYTLITFIILVLGSMGNFVGTLIGAFIIGVAASLGSVYISGTLGFLVPYLIFVAVLLFRPAGIMGEAS